MDRPLTELRLAAHQSDHALRSVLFGDGSTGSGYLRGEEVRLRVAEILNRMVQERLDLVGEIAALRAQRAERGWPGPYPDPLLDGPATEIKGS